MILALVFKGTLPQKWTPLGNWDSYTMFLGHFFGSDFFVGPPVLQLLLVKGSSCASGISFTRELQVSPRELQKLHPRSRRQIVYGGNYPFFPGYHIPMAMLFGFMIRLRGHGLFIFVGTPYSKKSLVLGCHFNYIEKDRYLPWFQPIGCLEECPLKKGSCPKSMGIESRHLPISHVGTVQLPIQQKRKAVK